jgi:predicted DNA-binding protein (UPF0251 family)
MARPKTLRKMLCPPKFKGFKPYGYNFAEQEPLTMLFEEYEAIRLCDYELLNHLEAAKFMNISRPTLTRIYESARRKVAKAFAEARAIDIEGGRVYFDDECFNNVKFGSYFNNSNKENRKKELKKCSECDSKPIFDMCED